MRRMDGMVAFSNRDASPDLKAYSTLLIFVFLSEFAPVDLEPLAFILFHDLGHVQNPSPMPDCYGSFHWLRGGG